VRGRDGETDRQTSAGRGNSNFRPGGPHQILEGSEDVLLVLSSAKVSDALRLEHVVCQMRRPAVTSGEV